MNGTVFLERALAEAEAWSGTQRPVCEGEAEGTSEGPLGWQSEGAPIEFKNIVVKELK